jgi:hypothetical protein
MLAKTCEDFAIPRRLWEDLVGFGAANGFEACSDLIGYEFIAGFSEPTRFGPVIGACAIQGLSFAFLPRFRHVDPGRIQRATNLGQGGIVPPSGRRTPLWTILFYNPDDTLVSIYVRLESVLARGFWLYAFYRCQLRWRSTLAICHIVADCNGRGLAGDTRQRDFLCPLVVIRSWGDRGLYRFWRRLIGLGVSAHAGLTFCGNRVVSVSADQNLSVK